MVQAQGQNYLGWPVGDEGGVRTESLAHDPVVSVVLGKLRYGAHDAIVMSTGPSTLLPCLANRTEPPSVDKEGDGGSMDLFAGETGWT